MPANFMRIDRFYGHSVLIDDLKLSSTVVDLGANHGNFAMAIAERFRCKPVCVEPDPGLYQALTRNPSVFAFNVAVTTRNGPARFYVAENAECSSLTPPKSSKTIAEIECQTVTLEALLASIRVEHVDVLKVDIEGLELELLNSLDARVLDRINQLTVEFHDAIGMGTVKQVVETIDHLRNYGFGAVRGSFFDYSDVLFLHTERLKMPRNWHWFATAEKIRNGISRRIRT